MALLEAEKYAKVRQAPFSQVVQWFVVKGMHTL